MLKKIVIAALIGVISTLPVRAQSVQQSGNVTPGHAVRWISNGVVGDAGTAASGSLTSLGVTNAGGPGICVNSGPITGAYNRLCLAASTAAPAQISLQNFGGAVAQDLQFNINGVLINLPATPGTSFATVSPPFTVGVPTCFGNTSGNMIGCQGEIDAFAYGLTGNGTTDNCTAFGNINTAVAAATYATVLVRMTPGTYSLDCNITLSGQWIFPKGAMLKPASGRTITFSTMPLIGATQAFYVYNPSTGTVTGGSIALPAYGQTPVWAEWWGAVGDNSTKYANRAFQAALDAVYNASNSYGGVVRYATGIFLSCGATQIKNNTVVQGMGRSASTLKADSVCWNGDTNLVLFYNPDSNHSQFAARWEDSAINFNSIAAITCGINGASWNEGSGLKRLQIVNYIGQGVCNTNFYGGAATMILEDIETFASLSSTASTKAMYFESPATVGYTNIVLNRVIMSESKLAPYTTETGIQAVGLVNLICQACHPEDIGYGIRLDAGAKLNGSITGGVDVGSLVVIGGLVNPQTAAVNAVLSTPANYGTFSYVNGFGILKGNATLLVNDLVNGVQIGGYTGGQQLNYPGAENITQAYEPPTPGAGQGFVWADRQTNLLSYKGPAGTISYTVVPSTAPANQFATGIGGGTPGVISYAQPTVGNLANIAANTWLGNPSSGTSAVAANVWPNCPDTGGNHINYVNGTGPTCGVSIGNAITALTGDVTATGPGSVAATLATVNSNVGTFGSATQVAQVTINGKGLTTAAANVTLTPAVGSITGLGTGVATALAVNIGSAGAPIVFNGALGTPSSGTLTNATGLPVSTGISGLGTGVATALAVNTGSAGAFVVNGGALGTPSSGTLTSATGLPVSTGISGLGTGVATALAVNIGSAGAPVTFNGALGTPSSGTLTNATGLPIATGISGLGTGVATALAVTPSTSGSVVVQTNGSWTPTLSFGGVTFTSTSGSYTTNSGSYQNIGKFTCVVWVIIVNAKGTPSGNATIEGLPTTVNGSLDAEFSWSVDGMGATPVAYIFSASAATTTVGITYVASGTKTAVTDTSFNAGSRVYGTGCYRNNT